MTKQENKDSFTRLVSIITRLRSEDGCPWDRKQTGASLKKYLLEETGELAEAIDQEIANDICEETGDLFYILILLTLIHEDRGLFTLTDVLDRISDKMIRRHPHVFADKKTGSESELRRQWQEIKANEK
ncbi:MAG: MazG nucleotide pyrophosphohydrolase domain-containing protein [Desulfobulbaceae bacterium]|nr:MazG nucleotide pyrophosphohydrolase domain-containing protein [Desulfobulbaceae bacterium]